MNIARQKIDMFLEDILIFKRKCSELLQLNRTMKNGQTVQNWERARIEMTVYCNIPVHTIVNLYSILLFPIYLFYFYSFIICVFVLSLSFCYTVGAPVTKTNSSYV